MNPNTQLPMIWLELIKIFSSNRTLHLQDLALISDLHYIPRTYFTDSADKETEITLTKFKRTRK